MPEANLDALKALQAQAAAGAGKIEPPKVDPPEAPKTEVEVEVENIDWTKPNAHGYRTFFSRLNGNGYVFKDGRRAVFEGGIYQTNKAPDIAELDELCTLEANFLIHNYPVPVAGLPHDVIVLRDVSQQAKTAVVPQNQTHRGTMSAAQLQNLVRKNR